MFWPTESSSNDKFSWGYVTEMRKWKIWVTDYPETGAYVETEPTAETVEEQFWSYINS